MRDDFNRHLEESLYVHFPLKPDGKSMEDFNREKKIEKKILLWDGVSTDRWSFEGEGEACAQDGMLVCHTYPRSQHWPDSEVRADDAANGFYATFGSFIPHLDVHAFDLGDYNRISFWIKPECPGLHSPIVRVGFTNEGNIRIPDPYAREGFNAMNLKNGEWNFCIWEIDSIAHDKIGELSFNFHRYGKEVSTGDDMWFYIKDISMQKVIPNVVLGWQCQQNTVVYSTTGYLPFSKKTAIANTDETVFSILNAIDKAVVFTGHVIKQKTDKGDFSVLDFTDLKAPGDYLIKCGSYVSESFHIGSDVFESTIWKLINFLYCERCGYPVPNKHGMCHVDVTAEHNGVKSVFIGGWHDAADVSQQTVQTTEITDALMSVAEKVKTSNKMLYLRIKEEVNWSVDFILRMNLGDGYHVSHAALRRWTDNQLGNMDDCTADIRFGAFEDFIFSAVESHAYRFFSDSDPELAWKCLDIAKKDFNWALERFKKHGIEPPHMREHTANASLSQHYAVAAWAAARLYSFTSEEKYADVAVKMADKVVACQKTDGSGCLCGFFYRDETHRSIVHFSHQGRDHIFVMALDECCRALSGYHDTSVWEKSIELYGQYLKAVSNYTQPYGLLPAGVFHISEIDDADTFQLVHPDVEYMQERNNYKEQLEKGIALGDGYFLKVFPVWFSYRGNSAIHLSMGKAASIIGKRFNDEELINIAAEQIYWTLGKNPFSQSLIYGEGQRYGQEYTALLGETVGEMPVGVQTRHNDDIPYWPPACIATYREVWTTPPGRLLWIIADLL